VSASSQRGSRTAGRSPRAGNLQNRCAVRAPLAIERCGAGCLAPATFAIDIWRCPHCASPLELSLPQLQADGPDPGAQGILRYAGWTPVPALVSLGEPTTPLLELPFAGQTVRFKHEGAQPTGSFKDRGSAALAGWLASNGADEVIEDSSGNAGASIAAYCARAGIRCTIYVPESVSPAKLVQAASVGARIIRVPGPRSETRAAAENSATAGAVYASHLWNPIFQVGTRTFAFEVWEQLGRRAPDHIVVPVGAGSLLLGTARGFAALYEAGLVDGIPRVSGVQSAACAPLARAFSAGEEEPVAVRAENTVAEGVKIEQPPRGRAILATVRETGGQILEIGDGDLWGAFADLARLGVLVEPTSALAAAGTRRLIEKGPITEGETVVAALTGSALKATDSIRSRLEHEKGAFAMASELPTAQ
jgi:threonine synthase